MALFCQRMILMDIYMNLFLPDFLELQVVVVDFVYNLLHYGIRREKDADIRVSSLHIFENLRGTALVEADFILPRRHLFGNRQKGLQSINMVLRGYRKGNVLLSFLTVFAVQIVHLLLNDTELRQEFFPRPCQDNPPWPALEQLDAVMSLHFLDSTGDAGLRTIQALCSLADRSDLCHTYEVFDLL